MLPVTIVVVHVSIYVTIKYLLRRGVPAPCYEKVSVKMGGGVLADIYTDMYKIPAIVR